MIQPKRRFSSSGKEFTTPSLFGPEIFDNQEDLSGINCAGNDSIEIKTHADAAEVAAKADGGKLLFISFGSGSSGNCSYLGTRRHGVLLDAGVNRDKVEEGLEANGIDINGIAGILLTHDHSDHICQAYPLLRRHRHFRLYSTPKTLVGVLRRHSISRRIKDYHSPVYIEHEYKIGPFTVTAFGTSHDGTDNVGYMLDFHGRRFVLATDMGRVTERANHYIRLANHLVIESNYDLEMLTHGTYPEYLQARIISERGHLDNTVTAALLKDIYNPELHDIFLCHLSADNNTPEIALATAVGALREAGAEPLEHFTADPTPGTPKTCISVLPRYDASPLYVLR